MIVHAELVRRFHGERSLPDGVIENTTIADWIALLAELRSRAWVVNFGDDLVATDLFPEADGFEFLTIKVTPIEGVQINIFAYQQSSIDFDFDTAELHTQVEVDALTDFIEAIGRSVHRRVVVSHEGDRSAGLFEFDIATGEFRFANFEITYAGSVPIADHRQNSSETK